MVCKGVLCLVYVYLWLNLFVVWRYHDIDWGVVLHRMCAYWMLEVVMIRWNILGSVAGSRSCIYRMSLGLAVARMRCVATRRRSWWFCMVVGEYRMMVRSVVGRDVVVRDLWVIVWIVAGIPEWQEVVVVVPCPNICVLMRCGCRCYGYRLSRELVASLDLEDLVRI